MTFLKKLGTVLANVAITAGKLAGVFPFIQPMLGSGKAVQIAATAVNDLTAVAQQVVLIETALQGKEGTAKFEALIPLVTNVIKTSELVSGKKISDEARFTKGVQEIAQGVVDVLNSIHPDEAKTT